MVLFGLMTFYHSTLDHSTLDHATLDHTTFNHATFYHCDSLSLSLFITATFYHRSFYHSDFLSLSHFITATFDHDDFWSLLLLIKTTFDHCYFWARRLGIICFSITVMVYHSFLRSNGGRGWLQTHQFFFRTKIITILSEILILVNLWGSMQLLNSITPFPNFIPLVFLRYRKSSIWQNGLWYINFNFSPARIQWTECYFWKWSAFLFLNKLFIRCIKI